MSQQSTYEMILREPESILKKTFDCDVKVIKCNSEPLVKAGSNYGSTLLKVNAVIKKNDNSNEEELNLVAKLLPNTDFFRNIFESDFSFKKCCFIYEDLLPTYQKIYGHDFEFAPKYYGSRFSLKPNCDTVDDDAVLFMENLKFKGYYMADRQKGLDLDHLKVAVTALAKFHAIGLSLKHKEPSYLEKLKIYAEALYMDQNVMRCYVDADLNVIKNDPIIGQYYQRVKSLDKLEHIHGERLQIILEPEDPWACVVHRDFWMNNMLFHRNDDGKVDNIRIVDFQTYCVSSPMTDLVFFLCTNCKLPLSDYFDDMLELYRQTAYDVTEELGCDCDKFTKDTFEERLKIDARSELYHAIIMTRIVEFRESEDTEEGMPNEFCLNRLRNIVELYINKEWI